MANTSNPCGLKPIDQPFGTIRVNVYRCSTGTVGGMFLNQPVDLNTSGLIHVANANSGNYWLGSIVGFLTGDFGPIDSTYPYLPANPRASDVDSSGNVNVLVADDPQQRFVIEESSGTALTIANCNNAASFAYFAGAASGNTKTGICTCVLDAGHVSSVGSNAQLRMIAKLDKPDNAYGSYCKWVVMPQYHRYSNIGLLYATT
jgi:hypothetical protein